MRAFPHTPINVEIKGRTPTRRTVGVHPERRGAGAAAEGHEAARPDRRLLPAGGRGPLPRAASRGSTWRPASPASAAWLGGGSPGPGVVAFQVPITYGSAGPARDHDGRARGARPPARAIAWQNWFSGDDADAPGHLAQPDRHVRGRHDDLAPARVREGAAGAPAPEELQSQFCGSRLSAFSFRPSAALPSRKSRTASRPGRAAACRACGRGPPRGRRSRACARAQVLECPGADQRLRVALLLDPADRRWAARRRSAASPCTRLDLGVGLGLDQRGPLSASRSSTSTSFSEPCHSTGVLDVCRDLVARARSARRSRRCGRP